MKDSQPGFTYEMYAACDFDSPVLTRSTVEIDSTLFQLYSFLRRAPAYNSHGESIPEAVRAQIRVLRGRMTRSGAIDLYEDNAPQLTLYSAISASEWMRDNGPSLMSEWQVTLKNAA